MPEQNEWTGDSGDYRWHEVYARAARLATTGGGKTQPAYDLRTLGDKVTELQAEVARLRALLMASEGDL